VIVLDASVWVSALHPQDVNYRVSDQWLAAWTGAGNGIVVPTLFLAEVGGAVARRASSPGLGRQAIADILADSSIQLVAVTLNKVRQGAYPSGEARAHCRSSDDRLTSGVG
jgi:predicted nucleic acid-binding protein